MIQALNETEPDWKKKAILEFAPHGAASTMLESACMDAASPETAIAVIEIHSGGLATSGDYERCLEIDGHRYGHILNSKTGWPVQGYASISVQASSCLAAGAISTVAMLKGKPGGNHFLKEIGLAFLTIDHHGRVTVPQTEPA